ncbi:hypothetical protein ACLQ2R_04920 [Streptosporangium sp. DT93]|uniref:hypothetical protein n=1 Tax=Streptosporangium sp. DT93 TaxID=3393428 RepID=UPI003CEF3C6C
MKLSVQPAIVRPETAVATVDGEPDLATTALLDAILLPLPGQGVRYLIVAADRLRFCDLYGLRVPASVHTIVTAIRGALVIAAPSLFLRRLPALLQPPQGDPPAEPIRIYPSLAQALRGENGLRRSSLAGAGLS